MTKKATFPSPSRFDRFLCLGRVGGWHIDITEHGGLQPQMMLIARTHIIVYGGTEPPWDCRRPFGLSHAAAACGVSVA